MKSENVKCKFQTVEVYKHNTLFIKLKPFLGLLILLATFVVSCQPQTLKTLKYAGLYSYSYGEEGPSGSIIIYPETDDTILFYIELSRGAPSYNSGALYGRVNIENNRGKYYTKFDHTDDGCEWDFIFEGNSLKIETVGTKYECGFGYGVTADGVFKKESNEILDHFQPLNADIVYFEKTKPEEYNQD